MDELPASTAAVLRALRERDENTSVHCERTCALSIETGRAVGLSAEELDVLRWAADCTTSARSAFPIASSTSPAASTTRSSR